MNQFSLVQSGSICSTSKVGSEFDSNCEDRRSNLYVHYDPLRNGGTRDI